MIDFLHWYFANYDPLLYERPVWYTTIVIIDQVVYGPFYIAALYAFCLLEEEWIRNWSIIWASVMLATVTVILGEEIAGPFASDHLPLVRDQRGWLIVPVWVLIRMWREHPFTRPVTAGSEN